MLEQKEEAFKRAGEELPTKAKYDGFVAKFRADAKQEKFLDQFNSHSNKNSLIPMLIFMIIIKFGLFALLYLNFTEDAWELNKKIFELPSHYVGACRFLVGMILHIIIDSDYRISLQMMHYAMNHPWKFRRFGIVALSIALLQFILAFLSELVSVAIICTTETYIDAVANFVALAIINDFDNFFFNYLAAHDFNTLISGGQIEVGSFTLTLEDLLKIEVTSVYSPDIDENDPAPKT